MRPVRDATLASALIAATACAAVAQETTTATEQSATEAPATSPEPETPVAGQILLQSADTVLASDLIGARVFTTSQDPVGDINDLIVGLDGTVTGVVVGVGGFLGVGEKDVAIEMGELSVEPLESGSVRIFLNLSRGDLDAAPAFKDRHQQNREEALEQLNAEDPDTADPKAGTAAAE